MIYYHYTIVFKGKFFLRKYIHPKKIEKPHKFETHIPYINLKHNIILYAQRCEKMSFHVNMCYVDI